MAGTCQKIVGGTLVVLVGGVNIRATGDWTLRLNRVIRTPVEDGGCLGAVTQRDVPPGFSGQITDCNEFKMSDFQNVCDEDVIISEPSGKFWIFKRATYINEMTKTLADGRVTVDFVAEDYQEQLPTRIAA